MGPFFEFSVGREPVNGCFFGMLLVSPGVTLDFFELRIFLFNQYSKGPYQEIENIYELSDCTPLLLFV